MVLIKQINGDTVFYGDLNVNDVYHIINNNEYEQIHNSNDGIYSHYYFNADTTSQTPRSKFKILANTNVTAIMITIKNGRKDLISIQHNDPYISKIKNRDIIVTLNDSNTLVSNIFKSGLYMLKTNSIYTTARTYRVIKGERVYIPSKATGVSYYGFYVNSITLEVSQIENTSFNVPDDGFIETFNNSADTIKITVYPAEPVEINDEISKAEVPSNINVLDPLNFTLRGYLNTSDGVSFVSSTSHMCTNNFIDIPFGTTNIYAKFPQVENNQRTCAFLLYDSEGNFSYASFERPNGYDVKMITIPSSKTASKMKFWSNKTTVVNGSNYVCLSFSEPSNFISYNPRFVVDNYSLQTPEIYLPFKDKKIVCFGDSLFGNKRSPVGVTDALKTITGAAVYNIGFGGTTMSARPHANFDAFSFYRLAYSITHNDFSIQNAVDEEDMPATYYPSTLALLKTINFNNVDIITIAYGTNDFAFENLINNENNPVDTSTFCGALRYGLQQIMATFPHIKIFVCGQAYRFWLNGTTFIYDSDTYENRNNDKLTDFVKATKDIADEYHVPFIDNYYELGINYYNRSRYFPDTDGVHHNYLGAKLIAEHIKSKLF